MPTLGRACGPGRGREEGLATGLVCTAHPLGSCVAKEDQGGGEQSGTRGGEEREILRRETTEVVCVVGCTYIIVGDIEFLDHLEGGCSRGRSG